MKIKIRKYLPTDKLDLKKCIIELKRYEGQFDADYLTDKRSVDKLFNEIINGKNQGGEIFVAEVEDKVVGFIALEIQTKNDELIVKKIKAVYVADVAVLAEYRNLGIGSQLLKTAQEFAKNNKIKYLKLIVYADNQKARQLYENMGFRDYEVTMLKEVKLN